METEELSDESAGETVDPQVSVRGLAGFVAGIIFGAFLGGGLALLFAPERGDKTRGRLRRRMQSLGEDALEGIDRASTRTREELRRRQRGLRKELERVRERGKQASG